MRKFNVTVNGKTYQVEVEELNEGESISATKTPVLNNSKQSVSNTVSNNVPTNGTTINAPMPGTIVDIKVSIGQQVEKGDVVAILEAMKMENEIVTTVSGKIATVNVSKGALVESGQPLISIG